MKAPRDILLQKHQAADLKLDQLRRSVVAQIGGQTAAEKHALPVAVILKLWFELIWPARRIWAGLAAVWVALAVFNFSQADTRQRVVAKSQVPAAEMRMAFQEQQRLLAEILGPPPAPPTPAEPPRRNRAEPRSDRKSTERGETRIARIDANSAGSETRA